MTLLIGLNSGSVPQWPVGKDPYTWNSAAMQTLANGTNGTPYYPSTLNDGSYINIYTSITLYNVSNVAVWTKTPANILSSATGISTTVWIDTVEGALYGLVFTSSLTYLYKIIISTGVSTVIGSGFATPGSSFTHLSRAAQGSGDFTLFSSAGNQTMPSQTGISSTTGAITVPTAAVKTGSSTIGNMMMTTPTIAYRSLDGTILLALATPNMGTGSTSVAPISVVVYRNGKAASFAQQQMSGYITAVGQMNIGVVMTVIGNSVLATIGSIPQGQIPMMLRSDFDTFLANVCTYMGI